MVDERVRLSSDIIRNTPVPTTDIGEALLKSDWFIEHVALLYKHRPEARYHYKKFYDYLLLQAALGGLSVKLVLGEHGI